MVIRFEYGIYDIENKWYWYVLLIALIKYYISQHIFQFAKISNVKFAMRMVNVVSVKKDTRLTKRAYVR